MKTPKRVGNWFSAHRRAKYLLHMIWINVSSIVLWAPFSFQVIQWAIDAPGWAKPLLLAVWIIGWVAFTLGIIARQNPVVDSYLDWKYRSPWDHPLGKSETDDEWMLRVLLENGR